ncbi:MAG: hypothetical protein KKH67_07295 [candidate division Zixibacteria bacterium]|nr:hypothetical protein [candidate division Zixibacteria bacterium]MBU1470037.1 hypothetical protein [candidate division Zixibacteria bacterium]
MNNETIQNLLMKVVDGLATAEEEAALQEAIRADGKWEQELRAYRKIKEVTDSMQLKDLPDSYWQGYWASVYRTTERGIGWVFLSVGAIILLATVGFVALGDFFMSSDVPLIVKIGVTAAGLGVIILLVSILRERFFARGHERYEKEVER